VTRIEGGILFYSESVLRIQVSVGMLYEYIVYTIVIELSILLYTFFIPWLR